jgi:predicted house-cleaning NTP pyrophosphatase (Maf/HAM1 superfamily)
MNIYIQHIQEIALPNKYTTHYCKLIQKIINRNQTKKEAKIFFGYVENHHIVPRSIVPEFNKIKMNIFPMTAREHFIAHLLLTKMFNNNFKYKMLMALDYMIKIHNKKSSKLYEKIKKECLIINSNRNSGVGNAMYGKTHTNEAKEKIANAQRGRTASDKTKALLSAQRKGRTYTEERNKKVSRSKKLYWSSITNEEKINILQKTKNTILTNGGYPTGEKSARAKNYICIEPNGNIHYICGTIKQFCEEYGLKYSNVYVRYFNVGKITKCLNPIYLGWEFIKLE